MMLPLECISDKESDLPEDALGHNRQPQVLSHDLKEEHLLPPLKQFLFHIDHNSFLHLSKSEANHSAAF
jgi:hypothetical protein